MVAGKNIEAVVFDLDGTLLNTLADLKNSVNYALNRFHYPERTLEEIRNFVGNGVSTLVRRALPQGIDDSIHGKVLETFRAHYAEHCMDETKPYEGVPELLNELKRIGIRAAIVSNKAEFAVKILVDRFFGDTISVAVGDDTKRRRKPAPDAVFAALEALSLAKERAVYVGDSDVDIQTATAAGVSLICCTWGFREESFLREKGASLFIRKPEDLLPMLRDGTIV